VTDLAAVPLLYGSDFPPETSESTDSLPLFSVGRQIRNAETAIGVRASRMPATFLDDNDHGRDSFCHFLFSAQWTV
jgi:hypothetical protein